jgi:hypothetical protein
MLFVILDPGESVAVGRWLERGHRPSRLEMYRRDGSRARTHYYGTPRQSVRELRDVMWLRQMLSG